jgi:translation initiation factor IF-2
MKPRPPVVTVMGHVDHGKTSLLDAIRNANVVSGRGRWHHPAYRRLSGGEERAARSLSSTRRATRPSRPCAPAAPKATDIVILVVAADDSVMPQTVEAINHTKRRGVPMIVAINKMDKPDADPNRVRTDLLRMR